MRRTENFKFWIVILLFTFWIIGCGGKNDLEQAQKYAQQSQDYYGRAINLYKDLLSKNKDLDRLYFELGRLYYEHGDLEPAIEQFKQTRLRKAKKLLAIAYYRLGNYTDALEIFNKYKGDDEARYYYGLTSEKLNLYDQALDAYRTIKSQNFLLPAQRRINLIEKQVNPAPIITLDPVISELIKQAPAVENYPQAGALILSCDENVEVTPAHTQVSSLHYIIKILNERGKEDFSEAQIDYDSTYEKVELEYARTIKPDGQVVDVGSRHIRDVSKYLNFPLYSNVRVYIISFPEISEGAVIEYKLKIYRSQMINKKDFVIGYPVQTQEPIISANFTLDLPEGSSVNIKTLNEKYNSFGADLMPKVQKTDGRLTYRWQFKDIPQIIPESNMPPSVQINPTILISTFNSWQDIYNWWWQLAKDKIKADDAIKNKVKELTGGLNSQEEKIKAIYNFSAQKIRYVAVEYGQAGYEPHKAEDIFKNKYGDCKDQAILLVTMLKEIGASAFPVLIGTREYYNLNLDFPSVMFNHCIAAVSFKDEIIFLDPTAQTSSFGDLPAADQNREVLIFQDDGYKIKNTPFYPAEHNLVRQEINIKLNNDESITAKKSVFTYGVYEQAQRLWLLYTAPQLVEEALKEKIQDLSIGAKLENYNIENQNDLNKPVVLNYEFKGSEYLTDAGPLGIVPQLTGADTALVAKDERRFPIDFNILDTKETIFNIELPENLTVKYIPESVNEDSPWLTFTALYKQEGNRVYFRQKVGLKRNTISQEEYSDFKNFFEGLAKKIKQRIVLEKKD